jgi:pimeloyl-ACP methyl ester carboxylesterase
MRPEDRRRGPAGMGEAMAEIELSAGSILYEDTGGEGPVIVLCHGLLMTASLWDAVVEELGPGFRCIRPTPPLGAHRRPMRAEADLSLRGQVRLLAEFLERLELEEGTLVFNDWCGAQLLVAEGLDGRVGRLVLASCETYDNYPPGLPGRVAALAARPPAWRPGRCAEAAAYQGPASAADDLRPHVQAPDPRRAVRPVAAAGPDESCDPERPTQVRRATPGRAGGSWSRPTRASLASASRCWWSGPRRTR